LNIEVIRAHCMHSTHADGVRYCARFDPIL
jgi:hypothetical protein